MTPSQHSGIITFGIITDIHFSTHRRRSATAINAVADLRLWVEKCKKKKVDFLLQLGDLIKGTEQYKWQELHQSSSILSEFSGTIHHVIGNHCLAIPRRELLTALEMPCAYFSFKDKGFRFIVIDGMDVSIHSEPETQEDKNTFKYFLALPENHDYCGAVGSRQKAWLKNELETAMLAGEKVIVISHLPLLPETTDAKYGLLWNHQEIFDLVSSFTAVKVCLCGHYHFGSYVQKKGIHFLVLPAFITRYEHPFFSSGFIEVEIGRMVTRNQNNEVIFEFTL